jgi:mono/diheme cytochrome c family protein
MGATSFGARALFSAFAALQPVYVDGRPTNVQGGVMRETAGSDQPAAAAPAGGADAPPYRVVDGDHVDADTLKGWQTYRALACDRCHGADQEGLVGPSLVQSLKVMTKDEFKAAVLDGRPENGMPGFRSVKTVVDNIDNLYAYLKGRSDGAIKPGKLKGIE